MMWHSENVMNCHSTWFNIDCKHLHTDPKTYAILLSNQSAARALLFVWSDSFFFHFVFCSFRSTSRGTFKLPHCFFFCLQFATRCCQRPHIFLSPPCSIFSLSNENEEVEELCSLVAVVKFRIPENVKMARMRTLTQWGKVVRHFIFYCSLWIYTFHCALFPIGVRSFNGCLCQDEHDVAKHSNVMYFIQTR